MRAAKERSDEEDTKCTALRAAWDKKKADGASAADIARAESAYNIARSVWFEKFNTYKDMEDAARESAAARRGGGGGGGGGGGWGGGTTSSVISPFDQAIRKLRKEGGDDLDYACGLVGELQEKFRAARRDGGDYTFASATRSLKYAVKERKEATIRLEQLQEVEKERKYDRDVLKTITAATVPGDRRIQIQQRLKIIHDKQHDKTHEDWLDQLSLIVAGCDAYDKECEESVANWMRHIARCEEKTSEILERTGLTEKTKNELLREETYNHAWFNSRLRLAEERSQYKSLACRTLQLKFNIPDLIRSEGGVHPTWNKDYMKCICRILVPSQHFGEGPQPYSYTFPDTGLGTNGNTATCEIPVLDRYIWGDGTLKFRVWLGASDALDRDLMLSKPYIVAAGAGQAKLLPLLYGDPEDKTIRIDERGEKCNAIHWRA